MPNTKVESKQRTVSFASSWFSLFFRLLINMHHIDSHRLNSESSENNAIWVDFFCVVIFVRLYHYNWSFDWSTRPPNEKPVIPKDTVYFWCWLIAIYSLRKFRNTMIKIQQWAHNSTINLFALMTKTFMLMSLSTAYSLCEKRLFLCSIWCVCVTNDLECLIYCYRSPDRRVQPLCVSRISIAKLYIFSIWVN